MKNKQNLTSQTIGEIGKSRLFSPHWTFMRNQTLVTRDAMNACVNTKPCFVFSQQEPGANSTEIMNGINHVRPGNGFQPNFQMFVKIDVNGDKEHALFTYLKVCQKLNTALFINRPSLSPLYHLTLSTINIHRIYKQICQQKMQK